MKKRKKNTNSSLSETINNGPFHSDLIQKTNKQQQKGTNNSFLMPTGACLWVSAVRVGAGWLSAVPQAWCNWCSI